MIVLAALLLLAAPPVDGDLPPAPGFATDPAPPAFRQPPRDPPINGDTAQAVVIRLIELHALASAADAADPAKLADALRSYQSAAGLKATGVLDKLTLAALGL